MNDLNFEVAGILKELLKKVGPSEFGLRIQGLFAHTLISLGFRILEIKHPGRPDIIADKGLQKFKFEVKVLRFPYFVNSEDIRSLYPLTSMEEGFLALLDCGPPIYWFLLPVQVLSKRLGEALYVFQIRMLANISLSQHCTDQFSSLIHRNKYKLENLFFPLLKKKALNGKGI